MREAVSDESKLALLDVLLDGVEELFFGDLHLVSRRSGSSACTQVPLA